VGKLVGFHIIDFVLFNDKPALRAPPVWRTSLQLLERLRECLQLLEAFDVAFDGLPPCAGASTADRVGRLDKSSDGRFHRMSS